MAVRLAPREITDLVYRSCRVAGFDAGVAHRLAANILHAEIHRSGGVQTYVWALAEGSEAVAVLARAADAIEQAEVETRLSGAATASFSPSSPVAAISQSLWDAAIRGALAAAELATAAGPVTVDALHFRRGTLSDKAVVNIQHRRTRAFREGMLVAESELHQLVSAAEGFLVAEATLDAILD